MSLTKDSAGGIAIGIFCIALSVGAIGLSRMKLGEEKKDAKGTDDSDRRSGDRKRLDGA